MLSPCASSIDLMDFSLHPDSHIAIPHTASFRTNPCCVDRLLSFPKSHSDYPYVKLGEVRLLQKR